MKLVVVYLLITVAFFHKSYGNQITLEEYEVSSALTFLDNETRAVECEAPGTFCSDDPDDCNSAFMCTSAGATAIKLKCATDESCNNGKCDKNKSPICEYKDLKFKCSTEGMYPEPSSCKEYNYCVPDETDPLNVNPEPIRGKCPTDWGYNPANTFCDKKLTNNICAPLDRPVPQCMKQGQNAALRTNPVLYYVCAPHDDDEDAMYPLILKCPNNQRYIGNLECR